MAYHIVPERPQDTALIEPLLDRTFGFDRLQKTVYSLRGGLPPASGLSFVALHEDGALLGSIRYWPILIEDLPALLLGPLAVEPMLQGQGIGKALLRHSLAAARRLQHRLCVVVGEPDYYRPFGFAAAATYGLILLGPVEPRRFQVLELASGALEGVHGVIHPAEAEAEPPRRRRRRG